MTSQSLLQKHAQIGDVSDGKGETPFFRAYVYLSAAVVAVIGVMMLRTSGVRLLATQQPDALLGFAIPTVLIVGGILHLIASICVFVMRNLMNQTIVLLWLGLNCFVYRAGLAWVLVENPPPVVQAVGMKFEIQPNVLDVRWDWFIAWLVIGNFLVLVIEWRRMKRAEMESFIKRWREERMHKCESRTWLSSSIFMIFIVASIEISAQQFEVEGELIYKVYGKEGETRVERKRHFVASVQGCKWLIRTIPISNDPKGAAAEYYEGGTDGTNTYKLVKFNKHYTPDDTTMEKHLGSIQEKLTSGSHGSDTKADLLKKKHALEKTLAHKQQKNRKSANEAVAEIIPSTNPSFDIDFIQPIWLAYASKCFFDTLESGRAPRVWDYEHPSQKFTNNIVQAKIGRRLSPPQMLEEVIFFNDGTYYTEDRGGSGSRRRSMVALKLPAPYANGYTNAFYHVSRFTNYNGMEIPAQFRLARLERVNDGKTSSDLQLETTFEGSISSVRACTITSFLPAISVTTALKDSRSFFDEDEPRSVQYIIQSGAWPSVSDTRTNRAYRQEQARATKLNAELQQKDRRGKVLFAFIVILLFVPTIFLSKYYFRREQTRNKNHKT